ncbi:MAG: M20 metallopeptidase family protein [Candidatus Poribacteria bacterium]
MNIIEEAEKIKHKLIDIREHFHKYPELSFQEFRTSQKIAELLKEIGLDEIETGIAKTGVVGVLYGEGKDKTIAIRADIDALPIQETNEVPYKSINDGVMHACGHDVHITTAIGSAMVLSKIKDKLKGNVKFIFQPAEEIFGGAKMMVEQGVLEKSPKVDAIIALHVWDGLNLGFIGIRTGAFMASADRLEIVVKGKGGHGAMPNLTNDPIVASAQIINAFQTVVSRSTSPLQPIVLSICKIEGGQAFNIIPTQVKMEGTLRTLDDTVLANAIEKIQLILKGVTESMDVEYEFNYYAGCPVLFNDVNMVELIKKAGSVVVGEENVINVDPTMGGEDFTYFARKVPGVMFCLGVNKGVSSPVHRPTFDVPSEAIGIGVSVLCQAVFMYLNGLNSNYTGIN